MSCVQCVTTTCVLRHISYYHVLLRPPGWIDGLQTTDQLNSLSPSILSSLLVFLFYS